MLLLTVVVVVVGTVAAVVCCVGNGSDINIYSFFTDKIYVVVIVAKKGVLDVFTK